MHNLIANNPDIFNRRQSKIKRTNEWGTVANLK